VADFQLKVVAETQDAEKRLRDIEKTADETTKARQIKIEIPNYTQLHKNFEDLKKDVSSAANTIQQFYRVAAQIPGSPIQQINEMGTQLKNVAVAANESRKSVGDAGDVIKGSLQTAGDAAGALVGKLTRIAFSLYVINEAAQAVQQAFGGLFKETIGREVKLRETILKTQTTLASTSKVFRNGSEITDPYQKIVSLTGAVRKNIDSIRERSIELAGVTSNEVIEVFGIVASQVGQIGGGLKEAEDLAINFAAALGTFGIPLYQARQEIGSILRADITQDSYLAKALGITNDDITKAKTESGGVVKFLQDRLAAAVAGQKIAAQGFSGVVSNLRDISELVSQSFGKGLLDPLLTGLTEIFNFLFKIREQLFAIAEKAGGTLGQFAALSVNKIGSGTNTEGAFGSFTSKALNEVEYSLLALKVTFNDFISSVSEQLGTLLDRAMYILAALVKGLTDLASGLLSLKLEQLKAAIGALETLSSGLAVAATALSGFLSLWGEFMKIPIVQQFTQIKATMGVLEATGVMPLIRNAVILRGVLANWAQVSQFVVAQFNMLRAMIGGLIAAIGTMLVSIQRAGVAMATAWQPSSVALQAVQQELLKITAQLGLVGAAAQKAGEKLGGLNDTQGKIGGGVVGLIGGMIKFQLIMMAVSAAISLVIERFSAWKEEQDIKQNANEAAQALQYLQANYHKLGQEVDYATKKILEMKQAQVDEQYSKDLKALQELQAELKKVREAKQRNASVVPPPRTALPTTDLTGSSLGALDAAVVVQRTLFSREEELLKKIHEMRQRMQGVELLKAKQQMEENIRLEADKRKNLAKEIQDINRSIDNDLFQRRQELAQKEVEVFRAAGELRIFQMEQANKKMLEGQEGASAAAMEALNSYLSTRERGELDIEAAKKALTIEVANLQKASDDYRLEIEKKIFDLRKRANENDVNATKYREQLVNQQLGGPVPADLQGRQEKAMGFFMSRGLSQLSAAALVGGLTQESKLESNAQNPKSGAEGIAQWLGTRKTAMVGAGARNSFNDQLEFVWQELQGSESKALGLLQSAKTLNQALLAAAQFERFDGYQQIGAGTEWGDRIAYTNDILNRKDRRGASVASGATTMQGRSDIPDPKEAADKYRNLLQSAANAMERLRALQAALTDAKTAAAFEEIAKAAFPQVALEQYRDQLVEAEQTLKALAETTADAYDPEALKISVDQVTQRLIKEREMKEILEKAAIQKKEGKLTEEKFNKLQKDLNDKKKKFLEDLKEEARLKKQVLDITRQQRAIEDIQRATGAIKFDVQRAGVQAQATMARAYAGDDPRAARAIEAEEKIANYRIELEQKYGAESEKARKELQDFAARTRAAGVALGELDVAVRDYQESLTRIRAAAATLTEGYKGLLKSALSGGDIKQAVGDMTRSITDKLTGMVLDAAFKPMEDMFVEKLKQVFNIQDPQQQLQQENNAQLGLNTAAIETLTAAIQASAVSPTAAAIAPGQATISELQNMSPEDLDSTLTNTFVGMGDAVMNTSKKADKAAKDGEKNFGKFLGSMTSVATGALAIVGAIQGMQSSKGGTYETLMGISGIFMGLGSIFSGIGGLGKKALGGPISAGRPYLVGEHGPELVFSRDYGTVLPANRTQALLASTRGALGGPSAAAASSAIDANREALSASASLTRERYVERVLSSGSSSTEIKYSRVGSGDLPFVTEDDMLQATRLAAQEGARLGQQRTLAALRSNPSTRRSIGV